MQGRCVGRECGKLLRHDTAEASTACGFIPKEDELEIIECIVDIQTCAVLFQYSLVRVDRLAMVSHLLVVYTA
jgi:hypothetical protein